MLKYRTARNGLLLCALAVLGGCDGPIIQGSVLDDAGGPLEGVEIQINNTELKTTSDGQGKYRLGYVPGRFEVRYKKDGYEPTVVALDFSTQQTVNLSAQTIRSRHTNRTVIEALSKAIDIHHERYLSYYREKGELSPHLTGRLSQTRSLFKANLEKATFSRSVIAHVVEFSEGAPLAMVSPAYVKTGFSPLIGAHDGADPLSLSPGALRYFESAKSCADTIFEAEDGKISTDDPKFIVAAKTCYITYSGVAIFVADVLINGNPQVIAERGTLDEIRAQVVKARAKK